MFQGINLQVFFFITIYSLSPHMFQGVNLQVFFFITIYSLVSALNMFQTVNLVFAFAFKLCIALVTFICFFPCV